ncbi:TetR/AcrR family transcriptional regulator [Tumebacillus sp. ITR2]|uniref:TetR/AcrR family transcriptional regulator n=1 Tax=Tumebacillus amylolyticus TaxID=2801339 RepID=A0ABS1J993_9BACL|nr:TetR/AcrR family transcriptional regulator [Tumebacillus amylolyticus]MBL0386851.1 TetR/AcrR family transcriptional regulator [Tumebacillus amylolyticus]
MSRYDDLETKRKLVGKLITHVKKEGFQQLRTDDIAKMMDISKATLYKYFSSKDEIIQHLVDAYVDVIVDADTKLREDVSETLVQRFQRAFRQTLLITTYGSEAFHHDLREAYPELLERVKSATHRRNERLRRLYEEGMAEGLFPKLNATLLLLQDELMFRNLVNPAFLMEHNLSFRNALFDYYELKKHQLFSPEVRPTLDETEMHEQLEYLAQKISRSMV